MHMLLYIFAQHSPFHLLLQSEHLMKKQRGNTAIQVEGQPTNAPSEKECVCHDAIVSWASQP